MGRATIKYMDPFHSASGVATIHIGIAVVPFEGEKPKHFLAFARGVSQVGFFDTRRKMWVAAGAITSIEEKNSAAKP